MKIEELPKTGDCRKFFVENKVTFSISDTLIKIWNGPSDEKLMELVELYVTKYHLKKGVKVLTTHDVVGDVNDYMETLRSK